MIITVPIEITLRIKGTYRPPVVRPIVNGERVEDEPDEFVVDSYASADGYPIMPALLDHLLPDDDALDEAILAAARVEDVEAREEAREFHAPHRRPE